MNAANRFVKEVKFPGEVICDSMKNEALDRYNAHPERICIVQNGLLVHTGGKGPLVFYDIDGVIDWLNKCFGYDASNPPPPTSTTATTSTSAEEEEEAEGECTA